MPRAASTPSVPAHSAGAGTPGKSGASRKRASAVAGGALLALALGVAPVHAAAPAGGPAGGLAGGYAALGDSYAAGAGVPWQSDGLCMRSDHNYGHVVAAALTPSSYTDRTCAAAKVGALTRAQTDAGIVVNGPQLDAVTPDTSLVTMTIGGNNIGTSDLGFVDVVLACVGLAVTDPFGAPCHDHYKDTLGQRVDAAMPQLVDALGKIKATAPRAQVMIVGYPSILPDDVRACTGKLPVTTGDLAYLSSVLDDINGKVARAAAEGGASYVDTAAATKGHDSCSAAPWIEGILPSSPTMPLHPNATGERVIGETVLHTLGR
ncbi:SGNH/GDSL hydrolase family protein [Streptomyces sp. UNOC14_S4]|uniref:SGNH/GDSL hydrolase family protein n=1 Tax=Streptomyces sp. UNOC14_S4 TaxID=2872340 RepID=UPI001E52E5E7|nr:SGNH/GDSL hydrolase family protein [Streptomyces sp. UNOC14_S4]